MLARQNEVELCLAANRSLHLFFKVFFLVLDKGLYFEVAACSYLFHLRYFLKNLLNARFGHPRQFWPENGTFNDKPDIRWQ